MLDVAGRGDDELSRVVRARVQRPKIGNAERAARCSRVPRIE